MKRGVRKPSLTDSNKKVNFFVRRKSRNKKKTSKHKRFCCSNKQKSSAQLRMR